MFRFGLLFCFVAIAAAASIPESKVADEEVVKSFKEYLEKSVKGDGKTLEERMAVNPQAVAWENSGHYQGDIVLDDQQIQDMVSSAGSRKAYIWPNTRWPQNTVVYEFAAGHFTAHQRQQVIDGINDISRQTCVRFRLRNAGDSNFVRITNFNDGCYAHVGFWGTRGVHTYNLANGCFRHTIIVHEWLHIIGFVHMQSTYNRDRYVTVMWQNIQNGMQHNFDLFGNNVVSNLGLPYEYASNMHYDRWGFSVNGQPTLLPNFNDYGMMGQQQFITATDWRRVNRHYNCPGAWN